MGRLFYILAVVLLLLVFPIVWLNFHIGVPLGGVMGLILLVFGLILSGPLLILYSLLLHLFVDIKGGKLLSLVALLIGLSWVLYLVYMRITHPNID